MSRLTPLQEKVGDAGNVGILIRAQPETRYISGITSDNAVLFVQADRVVAAVPPLDTEMAVDEARSFRTAGETEIEFIKYETAGKSLETISNAVFGENKKPEGKIAVQETYLTLDDAERIRKAWPDVELVNIGSVLSEMRQVKDGAELELIRRATDIGVLALKRARDLIESGEAAGMKEIQVAAELESIMRRAGSEGSSFDTICVTGTRSSRPHGGCSPDVELKAGDPVTVDLGARWKGYRSDLTRSFIVGGTGASRDAGVLKLFRLVLRAQDAGRNVLKAGAPARDVDAAVRAVFEKEGVEKYFLHSTGHGVGLEVHEAPQLAKTVSTAIPEGSVVTIEPGLYVEGVHGCRFEDMFLVTGKGYELLSDPKRGTIPPLWNPDGAVI